MPTDLSAPPTFRPHLILPTPYTLTLRISLSNYFCRTGHRGLGLYAIQRPQTPKFSGLWSAVEHSPYPFCDGHQSTLSSYCFLLLQKTVHSFIPPMAMCRRLGMGQVLRNCLSIAHQLETPPPWIGTPQWKAIP